MTSEASITRAVILAVDLGTTTGFCVGSDPVASPSTVSGTVSFKPGRYEGGGMRFVRFKRWLDEVHASYAFTEVYFEEVRRHAGTDAAHVYGGLMAHLTAWCEDRAIPYEGVPVGTIKKHWTGKGNASKGDMILASRRRILDPEDDNEADAQALFDFIQSTRG